MKKEIVLKDIGDRVYDNEGVTQMALITYGIADFTKVTRLPVSLIVVFPFCSFICKYSLFRSDSYSNFYCLSIDKDKITVTLKAMG